MKKGGQKSGAGFTIVESLIVIAVTGLLFVLVGGIWSSTRKGNEFLTAAKDAQAHLQQMVSEVENGYFPGTGNFSCNMAVGAGSPFSTTATEQGRNANCVFLGKVMQFDVGNTNPETYNKLSVAGRKDSLDITAANPTIAPRLVESGFLKPDLVTTQIRVGAATGFTGIAVLADGGTLDANATGRQSLQVYGVRGSLGTAQNLGSTNDTQGVRLYPPGSTHGLVLASGTGAQVCFRSNGTGRYAVLTIGASGSNMNVSMDVRTSCA